MNNIEITFKQTITPIIDTVENELYGIVSFAPKLQDTHENVIYYSCPVLSKLALYRHSFRGIPILHFKMQVVLFCMDLKRYNMHYISLKLQA